MEEVRSEKRTNTNADAACGGVLIMANPGCLSLSCRNFHEVRACDISKDNKEQQVPTRYTISSFVGFLPAHDDEPDTIVLWS